jgi:hypothetical protein
MDGVLRPALLALLAAACGTDPPAGDPLICGEALRDLPVGVNRSLDILVVIDTAPSMAGEQASLATNIRRFASVFESIEGGLPDLHLGVITADLGAGGFAVAGCGDGDDGALHMPTGCGVDGAFLTDEQRFNGDRVRNYTGSFEDAFACMAAVGAGTCAIRQPLAAALRALDADHPVNQGFLRDDAFLGIVVISDGDDCSAPAALFDPDDGDLGDPVEFRCFEQGVVCDPDEPRTAGSKSGCAPRPGSLIDDLAAGADALRALKGDPAMVGLSLASGAAEPVAVELGVGGPMLAPACSSAAGEAGPAVRLHALADAFPNRSAATSLCNEDLSDALVLYAQLLAVTLGSPCLDAAIDRDLETPGPQVECSVSDVRFPGSDVQEEQLILPCDDSGTRPCWRVEEDPQTCPDGFRLSVDREFFPLPGTHVQVRCRTLC